MDMTSLASSLCAQQFGSAEAQKLRFGRKFEAVHPRWDLKLYEDEPYFILPELSVSDISECSERSYDEDAVSPTATVAFVRRLPRETSVVLSQGSALSPTSTFWGDLDEYKQPSHPEDVRCVRYRPSFVKMLSHFAAVAAQKLRKIVPQRKQAGAV